MSTPLVYPTARPQNGDQRDLLQARSSLQPYLVRSTAFSIPSGQSTSVGVDLQGEGLHQVLFPAALTGTTISFQISYDAGVTYLPIKQVNGTLYTVTFSASSAIQIPAGTLPSLGLIQIVSSDSEAATRAITLVTRAQR